jgi:hypothetical protein
VTAPWFRIGGDTAVVGLMPTQLPQRTEAPVRPGLLRIWLARKLIRLSGKLADLAMRLMTP